MMSGATTLVKDSAAMDHLHSFRSLATAPTPTLHNIIASMLLEGDDRREISRRVKLPLKAVNAVIIRQRIESAARERAKRLSEEADAPEIGTTVSGSAIPLRETTRYNCMAPLGKNRHGEHMCCGKPKDDLRRAYCEEHHDRFHVRMTAADAMMDLFSNTKRRDE